MGVDRTHRSRLSQWIPKVSCHQESPASPTKPARPQRNNFDLGGPNMYRSKQRQGAWPSSQYHEANLQPSSQGLCLAWRRRKWHSAAFPVRQEYQPGRRQSQKATKANFQPKEAKRCSRGSSTARMVSTSMGHSRGRSIQVHGCDVRSKYHDLVCSYNRESRADRHLTDASRDNLVKLIRYVQVRLPTTPGFAKQESLLGNRRQRIAIISQMIASQKECRDHTDIAQLLILAKSSKATDVHDMVYAFQGLTHLSTFPDYSLGPVKLFGDTVLMYANDIQWTDSYAKCHGLSDEQKTFQLMSIIYSAGALHQDLSLPSFIPDFTCPWRLAPFWSKSEPNFVTASQDKWSLGIRTQYRAGGERREEFRVMQRPNGRHVLRISALVFDEISLVTEHPTPDSSQILSTSPAFEEPEAPDSSLEYGRNYFTSIKGHTGLATEGVMAGDKIAILPGGDVPVVIRPVPEGTVTYRLLCECYVQSQRVMYGDLYMSDWTLCEDIVFI